MTARPPRHIPLARLSEGYWVESRRPMASLVFIAPLLIIYEIGVLLFDVRNGADALMRELLEKLGFGQYFLLPILTVGILLGWHYTTRQAWRLSRGLLWGMTGECLLLSICLWLLTQLQYMLLQIPAEQIESGLRGTIKTGVSFLGAGIYEELLFRLILLSLTVWVLKRLKFSRRTQMASATLLTSLLFAAAHFVGQYGYPLEWRTFLFLFLAGVFFAILFVFRGFGIAAGAHAGYDILAGLFPS